ncbi:DUF2189 domain-containing protein [Erythrobacter insulae]|uniref:DUF2189 domain-containing protein n=1 Tax=Erythrobacter insulae TaxID=2584124 RepID=A0A547PEU0_9SPHN|nr:DUF2189 domain-containing protein [Erythrobacter insulae]
MVAQDLSLNDLRAALRLGWRDFIAEPVYGLFFGGVFAVSGIVLSYVILTYGEFSLLIPAAAGFPILAPFTAVGLYEVSRRREERSPIGWRNVLGAVKGRGDEQILAMGVIIFVAFGFWVIVAHAISAIFLSNAGAGSESLAFLFTSSGIAMLAVGSVFGGAMALAFYAMTVVSLPMLVDRNVDLITAILASIRVVRTNLFVMFIWAAIIAFALFVAIATVFAGLLIALPVLGHATWHLYRRAITVGG